MSKKFQFIESPLEQRALAGELRQLKALQFLPNSRVRFEGQEKVNFSSNDYLGLAEHPELLARSCEYAQKYGTGVKASRLVSGNILPFFELEEKLARAKGAPAALLFNSGFQLNVSLIPTLIGKGGVILMDRLIHNSMIQGSLLSGAKLRRFRHNDLAHLEILLQEAQAQGQERILILAESVYSMDGDRADLARLQSLADQYQALLLVDEAHATGVLGQQGMGLASGLGIDLVMGTFGKALGSFGAYLTCPPRMKEYLINFCPGLIYTTALPPQVLGAMDAALDLVPQMEQQRQDLARTAEQFRLAVQALGFSTLDSSTQIVPVVLGDSRRAVACSQFLLERGFMVSAIRPPTVEEGKARLRIALNALHQSQDIEALLAALAEFSHV